MARLFIHVLSVGRVMGFTAEGCPIILYLYIVLLIFLKLYSISGLFLIIYWKIICLNPHLHVSSTGVLEVTMTYIKNTLNH